MFYLVCAHETVLVGILLFMLFMYWPTCHSTQGAPMFGVAYNVIFRQCTHPDARMKYYKQKNLTIIKNYL